MDDRTVGARVTMSASTRVAISTSGRPCAPQHAAFVVVDCNVARLLDDRKELGPIEQRHALPRIEDERNARLARIAARARSCLPCRPARQCLARCRDVADAALMRVIHCTRVKRRDLVVVEVGDDEGLPV
jgi:hypothetical protein